MLSKWTDALIDKTIEVFKPYADRSGESFTREDAIESLNNMVALFELLIEIDRDLRKKELPKLINVIKQIQVKKSIMTKGV